MNHVAAHALSDLEASGESRLTGTAAGALYSRSLREVRSILRQNANDRAAATKAGLARLHQSGIITAADVRRLEPLVDDAWADKRVPGAPERIVANIQSTYQEMATTAGASEVALAIVSMLNSHLSSAERVGGVARARIDDDTSIVLGAIAGAALGGSLFGPAGALAGAVVGGIVGGLPGECSVDAG